MAIPFLPLTLAALGAPLIGKVSGAKVNVDKALMQVNGVTFYAKLFLVVLTAICVGVLLCWAIGRFRRWVRQRRMRGLVTLFRRLQADLVVMQGGATKRLESSKRTTIASIKKLLEMSFFRKSLDGHVYHRMFESLALLESSKIPLRDQISMVDQWVGVPCIGFNA